MTLETPADYYQAIADELMDVIQEPWTSIEIEATRRETSINTVIVYWRPDGTEESRVNTRMIPRFLYDLAKVVSDEEKGFYKKCHFVLKNDGSFNVDFEY
ncbi:MAG: hypothetical protein ACTID3_00340 [Halomonas sp.]|uniref:hypothetical protein n=1 Tax=Halomonas sp. TaxID=1486246 RepID=UPI003F902393